MSQTLAPAVWAQYGRDAVVTRVVQLAGRDATGGVLWGEIESGRLAQGQSATRAYELAAGTCYWFVAAGDGNIHDVDLFVSRGGIAVARDQSQSRDAVVPGARPFCPTEAHRVQVRVAAFRGGGTYAIGVYRRAATPSKTPAKAGPNMAKLLDGAAARYATGMGQIAPPQIVRMAAAEDMEQDLRLEGGMCYRFVAIGAAGVQNIDIHVYQGAAEVAHDDATAPEAVASYCTTAQTPVRVRVRMAQGEGMVAFAPYSGGRQHTKAKATKTKARQPVTKVGGPTDDFLARQIRSHHSHVGEGRIAASKVLRTKLQTSQDHSFPVKLEAGRCYTFIAVGNPSVRDLDIYLANPTGTDLASDTGPNNHAVVKTSPCPQWAGTYTIRVRVFSGYGNVAVQAFGN